MAVRYVRFGNEGAKVSERWNTVLRRARKDGVRFVLNSGHRTIAEQWVLFRQNMVWSRNHWVPRPGRPLTAFPSPTAPHIRTGRHNHALDLENPQALATWLRHRHVTPTFPVPGESWHLELSGADLAKLWKRYR